MSSSGLRICKVINPFGLAPALLLPIFTNNEKDFYTQIIANDTVEKFVRARIECFEKCQSFAVNQPKEYYPGDEAVYVLFLSDGSYYIGSSKTVLSIYRDAKAAENKKGQQRWKHNKRFDQTIAQLEKDAGRDLGSAIKPSMELSNIKQTAMLPASFFEEYDRKHRKSFGKLFSGYELNSLDFSQLNSPISFNTYVKYKYISENDSRKINNNQEHSIISSGLDQWITDFNPEKLYARIFFVGSGTGKSSLLSHMSKSIKLMMDDINPMTNYLRGFLINYNSGAVFLRKQPYAVDNIFELREIARTPTLTEQKENVMFYNSSAALISISSQLKALDKIIIRPNKNNSILLWSRRLWTPSGVASILIRYKKDEKVNTVSNYRVWSISDGSTVITDKQWSEIEETIYKETPFILHTWKVELTPPVTPNYENELTTLGCSFWDTIFQTYFESFSEEDFRDVYWIKVEELYDNIALLCAKNVVTEDLSFIIIEGQFENRYLEEFLTKLYGKAMNEDNLSQPYFLILSSSLLIEHISGAFSEWITQHSEQFTVIVETKDTHISKEVT